MRHTAPAGHLGTPHCAASAVRQAGCLRAAHDPRGFTSCRLRQLWAALPFPVPMPSGRPAGARLPAPATGHRAEESKALVETPSSSGAALAGDHPDQTGDLLGLQFVELDQPRKLVGPQFLDRVSLERGGIGQPACGRGGRSRRARQTCVRSTSWSLKEHRRGVTVLPQSRCAESATRVLRESRFRPLLTIVDSPMGRALTAVQ